jgi:hypothetical protein
MTSTFRPTASSLLPELSRDAEIALLARVLWREGYGRDPEARLVATDAGGTRRSTPRFLAWEHLVAADIETATVEAAGVDVVELHDRSAHSALWAAIGEMPPAMDQSSSAGGGVPGVDLCFAADGMVVVRGSSVRSVHERAAAFEARCKHAWLIRAAGRPLDSVLPAAFRAAREQLDGNGFAGLWEAMARHELRVDPSFLASAGGR